VTDQLTDAPAGAGDARPGRALDDGPPGAVPPPVGEGRRPFLVSNRVSLVAGLVTVGLAAAVFFGMEHTRELTSLWVLLAKLAPFVAASIAIAWLDVGWAQRLRLHLIAPVLCFLVFFLFFVPRIFHFHNEDNFEQVYYTILMLVPFVILSLALALRLGGASTSTVLRLSTAMILLQLSGLEDLAFLTTEKLYGTLTGGWPQVWEWADHITVVIGHPPTNTEALVFIGVHVALAAVVLALPGRYVTATVRRLRPQRVEPVP
jgi:hypothetical protein